MDNRFFEKPVLNSPYKYPARYRRPVASLQVYGGDIFDQADQALSDILRKTAARDLDDLVAKGVLDRLGLKRGVHYVLARKK